jgi:hypothetical protein
VVVPLLRLLKKRVLPSGEMKGSIASGTVSPIMVTGISLPNMGYDWQKEYCTKANAGRIKNNLFIINQR